MIKIENYEVVGWGHAIRGMRNPMNSWDKSDSGYKCPYGEVGCEGSCTQNIVLGPNDHDLMMRLAKAGPVHGKFRRMITVYVDITAPLYWWKEFDTCKVGTVANSCSTMHKIHAEPFERDMFSYEHLESENDFYMPCENSNSDDRYEDSFNAKIVLDVIIEALNHYRELYLKTKDKKYWQQMIQLLPSSYNQKRTVQLNYEVLANIYEYRKNHKLDEWVEFCKWIETLPYSEIITGKSE